MKKARKQMKKFYDQFIIRIYIEEPDNESVN